MSTVWDSTFLVDVILVKQINKKIALMKQNLNKYKLSQESGVESCYSNSYLKVANFTFLMAVLMCLPIQSI